MSYQDKKFFTEYNPFGLNGTPHYSIKIDDAAHTPFAIVMQGTGIKNAQERAKEKADYIVECLNANFKENEF